MNDKDMSEKIQIGITSLVLIFTVLCLVVFCTLSLTSAKGDYKLVKKYSASVQGYYEVDSNGEEMLKFINETLIISKNNSSSEEDYSRILEKKLSEKKIQNGYNNETNTFEYRIYNKNNRFLHMKLNFNKYNDIESNKKNYKILEWNIQNSEDIEIYDSIPLWTGK